MHLLNRGVHYENLRFSTNSTTNNMDYRQKMVVAPTQKHEDDDDDDEDLEALRLAALQSLRAKDTPQNKPQPAPTSQIASQRIGIPQRGFYKARPPHRGYQNYLPRPARQNGSLYFQTHMNPNLIAIVPVEENAVPRRSEPFSVSKTIDEGIPSENKAPGPEESKFCRYKDNASGSEEDDDGDNGDVVVEKKTAEVPDEKESVELEEESTDKENQSAPEDSPPRTEEDEDDDDVLLMADHEEEDSLERLMDEMEREMNVDKPGEKKEKRSGKKDNRASKRKQERDKNQKEKAKVEPFVNNRSSSPVASTSPTVSKTEQRSASPYGSVRPAYRRRSLSPKSRSRKKSPRRSPRRSPVRQIKKSQRDPPRFRSPRKSPPRFSPRLSPRPRSPRLSPRRSPNRSPTRRSPVRLSPRKLSPRARSPRLSPRPRSPRPQLSRSPRISPRPRSPRPPRSRSPRMSPRPRSPRLPRSRSPARLSPRGRSPKLSPRPRTPRLSPRRPSPRPRSPRMSPRRVSPRPRSPRLSPRRLSPRPRSPRLSPRRSSPRPRSPRLSPRLRSPRLSPHRSPWTSPRNSPRLSPRRRRSPKWSPKELPRRTRPRSYTPDRSVSPPYKRESSPNGRAKNSPDPVRSKAKQREEPQEKAAALEAAKESGDAIGDPVLEARRRKFESTKPIDPINANKKIKLSKNKRSGTKEEPGTKPVSVRKLMKIKGDHDAEESDLYEEADYEFEDPEEAIDESSAATVASSVNVCSEVEPAKLEREKPQKKKKKKDKEIYQVHKLKGGELPLSERIGKEKKCKKRKDVVAKDPSEETHTVIEDLTVDEEADLRTELSRRRAERLNRTGPTHQQSARLVQSAFKGVVNEVVKSNAKVNRRAIVKDEKSNQKEVRRVTVLHRPATDLHDSEDEAVTDSKVPVRFRLGLNKPVQDPRESKAPRKNSKRQGRKIPSCPVSWNKE